MKSYSQITKLNKIGSRIRRRKPFFKRAIRKFTNNYLEVAVIIVAVIVFIIAVLEFIKFK